MKKFIIEVSTNWCGEDNQYGAYAEKEEDIEGLAQITAWGNFNDFEGIPSILQELFPEVEDEEYTDEQVLEAEIKEGDYFSYNIREVETDDDEKEFGYLEIIWDARLIKPKNKVCGDLSTGCDRGCMDCDVPTVEPEDCENCLREAEENGFEYEANFEYENDCWICSNCRQPV